MVDDVVFDEIVCAELIWVETVEDVVFADCVWAVWFEPVRFDVVVEIEELVDESVFDETV